MLLQVRCKNCHECMNEKDLIDGVQCPYCGSKDLSFYDARTMSKIAQKIVTPLSIKDKLINWFRRL